MLAEKIVISWNTTLSTPDNPRVIYKSKRLIATMLWTFLIVNNVKLLPGNEFKILI